MVILDPASRQVFPETSLGAGKPPHRASVGGPGEPPHVLDAGVPTPRYLQGRLAVQLPQHVPRASAFHRAAIWPAS